MVDYDKLLETYSLEEILELNNVTEADALEFLISMDFISIPDPEPIDCQW